MFTPSGRVCALVTASLVGAALAVAAPAAADPLPTVTSTTTTRVAPNSSGTLDGLLVSNVSSGEVQATLATSVGTVSIDDSTIDEDDGVTLSYGNHASGDAQITVTGSEAQVNSALATATLNPGDNAGKTASVSLTLSPADPDHFYLASTGHYYQYVPAPGGAWTAADNAAKDMTFQDQQGYLATIPNATVNTFLAYNIPDAQNVWFGARAYDNDGGAHARTWRWAKGEDESPRQGQVISNCDNTGYSSTCNFADDTGLYNAWSAGQPDNAGQTCEERYITVDGSHYFYQYGCWGGGEDYGNANWGRAGDWNDLPNSPAQVSGYLVEYGNLPVGANAFDQTYTTSSDVDIVGAPDAPSAATATAGDGKATVSFTAPADNGSPISSYTVTSSPGSLTATCPGSPCTLAGLTNGTGYTFTVTATNAIGSGAASDPSASVAPHTVPGAPTDVRATRGNGQAAVSFTTPADDDGGAAIASYTVTSAPGGFSATCPGSPCTVAGLTNGTGYTFTVVATNDVGASAASIVSNAVTPAAVPDAPTDVVATRGNGSASITFDVPATGGSPITQYTVTSSPEGKTATCDGVSACIVTGLTNGTQYSFTVVATNDVGDSAKSTDSNDVVPATTPGAPSITSLTSDDGALTVEFDSPASDGSDPITKYEYSLDGATWHSLDESGVITGLTNGTAYTVRLRAANSVGEGAGSSVVTATPATTPGTPSNVTAGVKNGAVTVTWQAPDNGGSPITGYVVTASPGGATCTTTGATSCTFATLPAGRQYTFSVRASNANGASTATGIGSGATSAPSAPALLTGLASAPRSQRVVAGDRVLTVTFGTPLDTGGTAVTGYQVSIDGGRHWLPAPSTSLVVPGVRNGTSFRVVVRAVNVNGAGPASAVTTTSTRQWFHDPKSVRARKSLVAVPANPARYRGPVRATRATARSHNGTAAMPASSLRGRQLQSGQAASLSADAFTFDSASLTAAGKRQVRTMAHSLRYVRAAVCEGYSDYGGRSARQKTLSRQRATAMCQALVKAGARVRMTVKGYGATRPAVIGGTSSDRVANRRVVLLVTK